MEATQGSDNEVKSKGNALVRFKHGILELLGKFATTEYWWEMIKEMTQSAIKSFLFACANTVREIMMPSGSTYGKGADTGKAFGGGGFGQPGYSPSPAYPTRDSTGDNRFPGFGNR